MKVVGILPGFWERCSRHGCGQRQRLYGRTTGRPDLDIAATTQDHQQAFGKRHKTIFRNFQAFEISFVKGWVFPRGKRLLKLLTSIHTPRL